jgi:hypothetical protein
MFWLIPLCVTLALVALVAAVFVASLKNARALQRDVKERFDGIQEKLEQQATALTDELLTRNDTGTLKGDSHR